ncbi:MAG: hypothetical protein DHS20C21_09010 [Gemmatimonadota bacterium]|nr:MAG: hypothetical protein DHS20C21_09010 [Gemmatimonadota bacterium]
MHPRTLMSYERIGLIEPERCSNRRVYSENDLQWLGCVQDINRSAGVSLHGLSMLLKFVPCWAVLEQAGKEESPCRESPGSPTLGRVDRAYSGRATADCRACGVYREQREQARVALENRGTLES